MLSLHYPLDTYIFFTFLCKRFSAHTLQPGGQIPIIWRLPNLIDFLTRRKGLFNFF